MTPAARPLSKGLVNSRHRVLLLGRLASMQLVSITIQAPVADLPHALVEVSQQLQEGYTWGLEPTLSWSVSTSE